MKAANAKSANHRKHVALAALFALLTLVWLALPNAFPAQRAGAAATPTPPAKKAEKKRVTAVKASPTPEAKPAPLDFPHEKHKLKCSECHSFPSSNWQKVREKEAFPDVTEYPKHESCLKCHRAQFFSGPTPRICSVCHVNPSPDDSTRFPFENPRERFDQSPKAVGHVSDFKVAFPHEVHVDVVAEYRPTHGGFLTNARFADPNEDSCKVCHTTYKPQGDDADEFLTKPPANLGDGFWIKKGTFKTAPVGHTNCFTCHNADTGITPAQDDCASCHKPRPAWPAGDFDPKLAASMGVVDRLMLDSWKTRVSAGKFRHEWSSHADLKCNDCHKIAQLDLLDPKTAKVDVMSCNMCHITETSDDGGILNYEIDQRKKNANFECVKCHVAFGRQPIPESHLKAVGGGGK